MAESTVATETTTLQLWLIPITGALPSETDSTLSVTFRTPKYSTMETSVTTESPEEVTFPTFIPFAPLKKEDVLNKWPRQRINDRFIWRPPYIGSSGDPDDGDLVEILEEIK